jgi:hypothetical protein
MSIKGSIVAAWPFLVLLASAGAGPNRSLPVPPIPPANPPTARTAPMPNRDAVGPLTPSENGPQVQLKDFRAHPFQQSGLGYSRGSQFQSGEDKRPIQTPGLTVRIPLQ